MSYFREKIKAIYDYAISEVAKGQDEWRNVLTVLVLLYAMSPVMFLEVLVGIVKQLKRKGELHMATMEMTYHEVNGLLYPNLGTEEPKELTLASLGKYGLLALNYLKENMKERYRTLVRFGMLEEKMHQVDTEANELQEKLMTAYLKEHKPVHRPVEKI